MAEAKKQTATKPRTTRTAKKTAATSSASAETSASAAAGTAKKRTRNTARSSSRTTPETKSQMSPDPTKAETTKPETSKPEATKPQTTKETDKPVQSSRNNADHAPSGTRVSVTIPLDAPVVGVAVKAATLPVTAAKKVAQNRNGIPAYVAVGGLAVIGAVEWPVAAVGGLGLAALRRWGPLKPAPKQESKKGS